MPLISEEYREQNRRLHNSDLAYGTSGTSSAKFVVELANETRITDILDYGCGKGTLNDCMNVDIKEYDPCIEGKDTPPEPADLVVCTDVLEHIEPECLDDVLDDLKRLAKRAVLLVVATRPALKTLADGRNAHLIVEPPEFWLPKLMSRWDLSEFVMMNGEFKAILKPKPDQKKSESAEVTGIHFTKIRVENTNSCKYTCNMCPREKMSRPTGIMTPEDYQLVLDRLQEYVEETNLPQPFSSTFYLHGYGEPLFDPLLHVKSAMVDESFPAAQSMIFTTLGVRRPDAYFDRLLTEGKLRNIVVSMYGFQEETYEAVQNGGDFHAARDNLRYLARLNKSLGNPCTIILQILDPYTTDTIKNDPVEGKEYDDLLNELKPLGVIVTAMGLHNFGDGRDFNAPDENPYMCSVVKGHRQEHFNVSWDLRVLPCCYDYNADIVFGDLRTQSIYEIYHGEIYEKFIAAHKSGNLDDYKLCKGCDQR